MTAKKVLPDKAQEILEYLIAYKRENNGNSPSRREMQAQLNISSGSLTHHLGHLLAKRLVELEYNKACGLIVRQGVWVYLPDTQEALAQAGFSPAAVEKITTVLANRPTHSQEGLSAYPAPGWDL